MNVGPSDIGISDSDKLHISQYLFHDYINVASLSGD